MTRRPTKVLARVLALLLAASSTATDLLSLLGVPAPVCVAAAAESVVDADDVAKVEAEAPPTSAAPSPECSADDAAPGCGGGASLKAAGGGVAEEERGAAGSDDDDDDDDEEEDGSEDDDEEEYEVDTGVNQWNFPDDSRLADYVPDHMERVKEYMRAIWEEDEELAPVLSRCKNKDMLCMQWAALGECENDPRFMQRECAPACFMCDKLLYERRCPYDSTAPRAFEKPGDLNAMFERIVSDESLKKYEPKIWSRPGGKKEDGDGGDGDDDDQPWVVSLENFLTDAEVARIIEIGDRDGFERSDDGGIYRDDGTFQTFFIEGRTSYNAWCRICHDEERGGPHAISVLDKIEEVTRVPRDHQANLQILRYSRTQHYHLHHDYDSYDTPRQPGPRVLTFFLYLSDVEEGGGTNFPRVGNNLTFVPRRGRAVLWPNVLNDNPDEADERTVHQALPVVRGIKYAANAWIHMHDWQGPMRRGCDE